MAPSLRALSSRDFDEANDRTRVRVDLPTLDGFAFVRELGADERDDFDLALAETRDSEKAAGRPPIRAVARQMRTALLRLCVEDEAGTPMFPTDEAVLRFTQRSANAARTLYESAMVVNGLGAKAGKAAEGESADAPSVGSPTV